MQYLLLIFMLSISGVYAQQITVEEIVDMKKDGLKEEEILKEIKGDTFLWQKGTYRTLKKNNFSKLFIKKIIKNKEESLKHYKKSTKREENISVLAVGINFYLEKNFQNLQKSTSDAKNLVEHFLSIGALPHRICLLTDKKATRKNFLKALDKITQIPGRVYIFYSGHGLYQQDLGFFFTFYNTKIGKLHQTAYSMEKLKQKLENTKAKRTVLILNSCYSGATMDADIEFGDEENPLSNSKVYEQMKNLESMEKPIFLMTSCRANEVSTDGLFTKWLMKGLRGAADKNKDSFIDTKELFDFSRLEVENQSKFLQRPDFSYSKEWIPGKETLPILDKFQREITKKKNVPDQVNKEIRVLLQRAKKARSDFESFKSSLEKSE